MPWNRRHPLCSYWMLRPEYKLPDNLSGRRNFQTTRFLPRSTVPLNLESWGGHRYLPIRRSRRKIDVRDGSENYSVRVPKKSSWVLLPSHCSRTVSSELKRRPRNRRKRETSSRKRDELEAIMCSRNYSLTWHESTPPSGLPAHICDSMMPRFKCCRSVLLYIWLHWSDDMTVIVASRRE